MRVDWIFAVDLFVAGKPVYGKDIRHPESKPSLLVGGSFEAATSNYWVENPEVGEFTFWVEKADADAFLAEHTDVVLTVYEENKQNT